MLGIIAGTGFSELAGIQVQRVEPVSTPYGAPSATVQIGQFSVAESVNAEPVDIAFLPRHGTPHRIPPHRVNYRANMFALQMLGCEQVVAVNAVGGIADDTGPGELIIPHDVIDYTYGRVSSYWDDAESDMQHVEMTTPYAGPLRQRLITAAKHAGVAVVPQGVMAVTQGPRLETAAEILRLQRDGCTLVGMTGMPEAALAKELTMPYASLSFSVNWAAGKQPDGHSIHAEIAESIDIGTQKAIAVIHQLIGC